MLHYRNILSQLTTKKCIYIRSKSFDYSEIQLEMVINSELENLSNFTYMHVRKFLVSLCAGIYWNWIDETLNFKLSPTQESGFLSNVTSF